MNALEMREADGLEVTILMDNYTDLFVRGDTEICRRSKVFLPDALLAEHGFSCLIKVRAGSEEHRVLMDAAVTHACLRHNAHLLNVDLAAIDSIILSHGHPDHVLGLGELLKLRSNMGNKTRLLAHPDAFLERRINIPSEAGPAMFPRLDESALERVGAELVLTREASLLAEGLIGMTGEVERLTPFETGFPWAEARIDGAWGVDPFRDDQGVVVKLKDRGIVVISGCAHAGIINTVEHAKKMTHTNKVYAVLGGFHLTGSLFERIIQPTVDEMKRIAPAHVVPMHCTGWKAINRFASEMPRQFILNTVGTTYRF